MFTEMSLFLKVIIIILTIVILFYLIRKAFAKFSYYFKEKYYKNLEHTLFNKYLDDNIFNILEEIKNEKISTFEFSKNIEEYKYAFTVNHWNYSIYIFQFKDDICTSFYLQSFLDRHSLPYWRHINDYVNSSINYENIDTSTHKINLIIYSLNKFIKPYVDTEKKIHELENSTFKTFFKIKKERYLAIGLTFPTYFSYSKEPVFTYLCSKSEIFLLEMRKVLANEYLSFQYKYIVNYDKLNKLMSE